MTPEQARVQALEHAIKLATSGGGHDRIVDAAKAFEAYLLGPKEKPTEEQA